MTKGKKSKGHLGYHWANIVYFVFTIGGALVLLPLYHIHVGWSWMPFVLFLVLYWASGFGITAGYHRLWAHRAYEASYPVRLFLMLFGAAAIQGSILKWSYDHRRHHREVDTDLDPYNINKGFWWAHMGWLVHHDDPRYAHPSLKDIEKDPLVRFQHRHYYVIAFGVAFGFPTLVGWMMGDAWGGFLWGGLMKVVLLQQATFFINSLAHTLGSRPYSSRHSARDSIFTALVTMGEGYHNYHHEFPSDYRNGVRWWAFDPTKWVVYFGSLIGQTWGLKRVPDYKILIARVEQATKKHPMEAFQERLEQLRVQLEHSRQSWEQLKEQYQVAKSQFVSRRDEKIMKLKLELQLAKVDFKMRRRQFREACMMTIRQARYLQS